MSILSSRQNGKTIELPAPCELSVGDEIIWSANTGRISTGTMVGDAIAEKQTLSVTWEYLTSDERDAVKEALKSGFFPLTVDVDGSPYTITAYRGTLTSEALGMLDDGIYYFRTVTCDIIEQ